MTNGMTLSYLIIEGIQRLVAQLSTSKSSMSSNDISGRCIS